MAVRTMGCSACGAVVPYGRLSCPECGELLASVSGARRDPVEPIADVTPAHEVTPSPLPDVLHEADDLASMSQPAWPGSVAVTTDDGVDALDIAFPPTAEAWPDDASVEATLVAAEDTDPVAAAVADRPPVAATRAEEPSWPEPGEPVSREAAAPPPGSYVPPPPFMTAASGAGAGAIAAAAPAGSMAPARAWAGYAAETAPPVAEPSASDDLADGTPAARIAEAIGWVAIAGAVLAAAGFLLPWARTMIGASGDGYLDRWGFAGPFHPLIVLAILAVLVLAVVRNPVPAWLRLGLPGLGLGAFLLGLLWPYVFGPLSAQPGAFVSMLGSAMLIGVGLATLVLDRHAGDPPVV